MSLSGSVTSATVTHIYMGKRAARREFCFKGGTDEEDKPQLVSIWYLFTETYHQQEAIKDSPIISSTLDTKTDQRLLK